MREVDDALRQDEMASAFKRYGRPAIAGLVLGLAGLAGVLWWQNMQKTEAGERGEQFTLALDRIEQGNVAAGAKQLTELAKAESGTGAAARMMQAGLALEQGKRDDALKLFAEVAADEGAPQPFRDLATIREVATRFDSMDPQKVVDRIKPLAKPGNAWFASAGELLGIAYMKQGRNELAGPLFAAISRDKEAPESLRSRARQMAGLLGVDAVDDPEKLAASGKQ